MSTHTPVLIDGTWKLVYSAAANGDFNGYVQARGDGGAFFHIGTSLPAQTDFGFSVQQGQLIPVSLSQSAGEKIYCRAANYEVYALLAYDYAGMAAAAASLADIDAAIGGPTAAAAGDTGASTTNGFLRWIRDWLQARTGQKTAANSMSVVLSSDGPFSTNFGLTTDAAATTDTGSFNLIQLIKRLLTKTPAAVSASGTISSAYVSGAAQVQVAVVDGLNTFSAHIAPSSFTGTLLFVFSLDGSTWFPLFTQRSDSFGNAPASSVAFSASSATQDVRANIPPGAAYIGVNCSPYSSGSAAVTLTASAVSTTQIVTSQSQLLAGTARVGFVASSGIGYNDSTTPVNAGQSITSAAKSTYNTSSATAWNAASSYGRMFRAAAGADVGGTLYVEYSNNSTDWYPVTNGSVALAQYAGTGNFGGSIEVPIFGVYMRARLVNGASNQTKVYLTTNLLG